jgi:hypothetical protein
MEGIHARPQKEATRTMSTINGTDTEIYSGQLSAPGCFVCGETKARVEAIAKEHHIGSDKIARMLQQACDGDNYPRDFWRTTVGGITFTFHLSRLKVELRKIESA